VKRAYSYIRFSRLHQQMGDSLRRQIRATEDYCRQQNLILDNSLNLRDLGVSAYKGRNMEKGALGRFIAACEDGKVEQGSALIVESLDRLSRSNPWETIALLDRLLRKHGIEVHLTMTRKVFTPLNQSGNDLMFAVAMSLRGWDESETKSKRLVDAFKSKREKIAGSLKTRTPLLLTKALPWWLILENGKIVAPPPRAKIVREIFKRTAAGESSNRIAFDFNACRIPTWRPRTKHWRDSRIRDLVNSEAPLGTLTETPKTRIEGRTYRIEKYYPKIVTAELAAAARASLKKNRKGGRPRNTAKPANILKSLVRYRGIWMRFGVQERTGPTGSYWNAYYTALHPDKPGSAFMVAANQIEPILLSSLVEIAPEDLAPTVTSGSRLEQLQKNIADLARNIKNICVAIEAGSVTMVPRLMELEREMEESKSALEQARGEQGFSVDNQALQIVSRFNLADLKDLKKRPQIAAAIHRIVQRIDVGQKAEDLSAGPTVLEIEDGDTIIENLIPDPTGSRGKHPLVMLVHFRGGAKRLIVRAAGDAILRTSYEIGSGKKRKTASALPEGILNVKVVKSGEKLPEL
jgi:DNA invertase Pin-like site-specific DNA recombinase